MNTADSFSFIAVLPVSTNPDIEYSRYMKYLGTVSIGWWYNRVIISGSCLYNNNGVLSWWHANIFHRGILLNNFKVCFVIKFALLCRIYHFSANCDS